MVWVEENQNPNTPSSGASGITNGLGFKNLVHANFLPTPLKERMAAGLTIFGENSGQLVAPKMV